MSTGRKGGIRHRLSVDAIPDPLRNSDLNDALATPRSATARGGICQRLAAPPAPKPDPARGG
eukprot:8906-Pyramimonas_sp.AAC.1